MENEKQCTFYKIRKINTIKVYQAKVMTRPARYTATAQMTCILYAKKILSLKINLSYHY